MIATIFVVSLWRQLSCCFTESRFFKSIFNFVNAAIQNKFTPGQKRDYFNSSRSSVIQKFIIQTKLKETILKNLNLDLLVLNFKSKYKHKFKQNLNKFRYVLKVSKLL